MLMYYVVQTKYIENIPQGNTKEKQTFIQKKNLAKLDLLLVKYNIKLEGKLAFAFKILQKERVIYYLQFFHFTKR